jgi:hypothetical protein
MIATLGARRAHGDTAIAQLADDLFGVLGGVFHQQKPNDLILFCHNLERSLTLSVFTAMR